MASLFVIKGANQGQRYDLDEAVVALGREQTNDIQLHDTEVSRRHAEVRGDGEGFVLVDLKSSNGTFVNNQRGDRFELHTGDRVTIGRTVMLFTAQANQPDEDLSGVVEFVSSGGGASGSRILKSLSHEEGSHIFGAAAGGGQWLARAKSNLQVMYRTALAVSHTLDIDELLQRILELIFEWVEADRGCVMLVDQESNELIPRARRTRTGVDADEKISISRTILDYVMQRQEGVLTSDARDDQRWDPGASILKMGVREAICVPLQGRYGVVGVIYIDTFSEPTRGLKVQGNRFSEEHLRLMVAIGHQAALAVEDTSYYSAMVQAERLAAVGQAIAALSHHIKNILQGIRGGSYLIEEGLKGDDPDVVRSGWGIVEKNQEKISNLVMDMLTFSKEREPEHLPADLNEVAHDVVELMQVRAGDEEVELVWQPSSAMPQLTFDPEGLHRAILNVVTNAIDACHDREEDEPPPGRVVISTQYDEAAGVARVVVDDTGPGIDAEEIKRIFRMFVSSKGHRGTGLGLSVSQKIIREHGGEIRVESEVGKGSRFILEIPAVAVEKPNTTSDSPSGTQQFQVGGRSGR